MSDVAYECLTQDEHLSEVRFVHEYVQFVLWPHTLSVYPQLRVSSQARILSPSDPGFYDRICKLIGRKLVKVIRIEGVQLEFAFSNGTTFFVSLRPEDAVGPEIAMLSSINEAGLMVERYDN